MADRYWVGGTANWDSTAGTKWAATSGGTGGASVPTSADDVFFTSLSTGTCTVVLGNTGAKSINCTGFTGGLAGTSAIAVAGSITLDAGMTYTFIGTITLTGTGTLTTAGQTVGAITVNGVGITVTLGDDLTMGSVRALTLTNGTFDANNKNVSAGSFVSSNTTVRTLNMGSGTWSLANTGFVWNCATSTNLTINPSTSTIIATNTTVSARTFAGGGKVYNNLVIGGTTGTSTFNFTGSNTFNTISSTKTVAHTILFTASTTTTVTNFTVSGTSGNVVTIGSVTAASHTLAKAGGGTITVDYASISRSTATPATTWYATNSTDGGNNSGWTFGSAPPPSTNSGRYFLLF